MRRVKGQLSPVETGPCLLFPGRDGWTEVQVASRTSPSPSTSTSAVLSRSLRPVSAAPVIVLFAQRTGRAAKEVRAADCPALGRSEACPMRLFRSLLPAGGRRGRSRAPRMIRSRLSIQECGRAPIRRLSHLHWHRERQASSIRALTQGCMELPKLNLPRLVRVD